MRNLRPKYIRLSKDERLYTLDVPVIGLTGGIGTGKSTVSKILTEDYNAPVICADKLVKDVYKTKEAKNFVEKISEDLLKDNQIDFIRLRELVFSNTEIKTKVENFIYSHLEVAFKNSYKEFKSPSFVIYDVPLLFEKNLQDKFDLSILVYASEETQRKRIKLRDESSDSVIDNILASQLSIEAKKNMAGFVIDNNESLEKTNTEIKSLINSLFED